MTSFGKKLSNPQQHTQFLRFACNWCRSLAQTSMLWSSWIMGLGLMALVQNGWAVVFIDDGAPLNSISQIPDTKSRLQSSGQERSQECWLPFVRQKSNRRHDLNRPSFSCKVHPGRRR